MEPLGDEPQNDMDRLILKILNPVMVSLLECDFYDDPNDHYFDAYFNKNRSLEDSDEIRPTHILCIDANGDELWIYVTKTNFGHPRTEKGTEPNFMFPFSDPEFLDKVRKKLNEIIYEDDDERR